MAETPRFARAYLGKINRYTRDKQVADCREAIKELGLPAIGRGFYEHNEMSEFISDLSSDEIALIPRLEGLAEIKGNGVGLRFLMNVMRIQDSCMVILDIDTGTRSDVGDNWYNLVEAVARKVMRGRPLSKKQARIMAELRYKEPGLEESWRRRKGTPEYKAVAAIWGNLAIKPAESAIGQFADDELRQASKSTIQRIWGTRQECETWLKNQ